MQPQSTGLQLRSTVKPEGVLELSLARVPIPEPKPDEVVVRIDASPINPSDLGLLFGGVDVSAAMVARAAGSAREAGLANVRFENADAQTHRFPAAEFDLLYSRFGVMFFADPTAAFTNLRAALRPGGRLAFICWQAPCLRSSIASSTVSAP